jgi:hypothetical protein
MIGDLIKIFIIASTSILISLQIPVKEISPWIEHSPLFYQLFSAVFIGYYLNGAWNLIEDVIINCD